MKTLIKSALLIVVALSLNACFFSGVKGNGHVVTEQRSLSNDFSKIKASDGLDVELINDKRFAVIVEADENLQDLIEVKVYEGTLFISSTQNIYHASAKKVKVSVGQINEIIATSGVNISSENVLKTDKLKLVAHSGSDIDIKLKTNTLECHSSSGADVDVEGSTQKLTVNSSSGSDIDAYNLEAEDCVLQASSGSNIKAYATRTLYSSTSSGGDIQFKGDPEILKSKDQFGGDTKKISMLID